MTKLKVLYPYFDSVVDETPSHLPEFEQFCQDFCVIFYKLSTPQDLIRAFHYELSDISGIFFTDRFHFFADFKDYIPHFPKSLEVVSYPWVGSEIFKPEALREKGINLCNVGEGCADDVADVALQLTLSTFRFTSFLESTLRSTKTITAARAVSSTLDINTKTGLPCNSTGTVAKGVRIGGKKVVSPRGRTAGIVGLGSIGKAIARRLSCIGLNIKYTKRTPLTEEETNSFPFDLQYVVSLEELIPQVDVLILCVPETPQTINMVNSKTLALFQKGSRIVNVGRGSAVNEDDLLVALDNGTISSFGADVFQNEPNIDERLLNRFDVMVLPHVGPFTCDNFDRAHGQVVENITQALSYHNYSNLVN
ncbi:hypothetical protein WICPIJ_009227 [Wickerhamomyces pijperi]|uniref:D-isomer specific 2-hydroxyacid dehydrogenase NAD-binding domain-containing protein n=1 Tax=Wickerhamomyces pijperi TaxID=599730 RepID=A0A9P8PQP6_WICPI|nr:hypothetical protein WICPIJ_009227 [Wickerhamomyces pijperi]